MSRATKRKHVTKEIEDLSVPTESQSIVRIVESRGNNLHEVLDSAGDQFLASMPTKFRRNIWVKRGDFVLVEPILEGDKVKAEIVKILTREHQRWYRQQKCWPQEFDDVPDSDLGVKNNKEKGSDKEEDELFVNTNRIPCNRDAISNESDSTSEDTDSS